MHDLEQAILDARQEDLHLDYKGSPALSRAAKKELTKDVSAFANSDGGVLVYGIVEEGHIPKRLDDGVPSDAITREWLEQTLNSNISPRVDGLQLQAILNPTGHPFYCITVPRSYRVPHQDRISNRYYKRYNFSSVPMEHYEIEDLRARAATAPPLVSFEVEVRHGHLFLFRVSNPGTDPALDVTFEFSEELTWPDGGEPVRLITEGIAHLAPGQEFHVYYGDHVGILQPESDKCSKFTVIASYEHPRIGRRVSETVRIDLEDYIGTWAGHSDLVEHGKQLSKAVQELTKEVKKAAQALKSIRTIAAPSGLTLSAPTVRDIATIFRGEDGLTKRHPVHKGVGFFEEVLEVDHDLGWRLARHFTQKATKPELEEVEGLTEEVLSRMEDRLILAPE